VLADDLSPQKARILLILARTKTRDPEALQKYFANSRVLDEWSATLTLGLLQVCP